MQVYLVKAVLYHFHIKLKHKSDMELNMNDGIPLRLVNVFHLPICVMVCVFPMSNVLILLIVFVAAAVTYNILLTKLIVL